MDRVKFLIAFGTRPEWIKLKPVIDMFDDKGIEYKTLFSGQHVDLLPKQVIDSVDMKLKINDGPNRLDSIVGSVMVDSGIWDDDITHVMIQGDTTSAFAIALAGFHRKLKVVHLEAGLRTYNIWDPYPEEFNRQAISRLTDLHLCPTELSSIYLSNEKVAGRVEIVGNTVLDNLRDVEPEYTNKVVVTMHRRENHEIIDRWFKEIDKIAEANKDLEFIIPMHPNPNVQKHKHLLKNLKIVEPMEYNEFIKLLAQTRLVISDSGGLQEETSFLKKKCIVCRKTTERLEGVNTFAFMCPEPEELEKIFNQINADHIPVGDCPYGDGKSAQKILEILKKYEI